MNISVADKNLLLDFDACPSRPTLADRQGGRIGYVEGNAKDRPGLCAALVRPYGCAWATDFPPMMKSWCKLRDNGFEMPETDRSRGILFQRIQQNADPTEFVDEWL
ncbi:hypothetical protein DUT91_21770 [Phyllobacterium salinisoli]|uniref:Uncharacterized protein n=1 Tax=Phyllobacterium salinisoli TaxID=1899321 RepID=A0A368JXC4_9HYPH|nr:hypothetical protein [Phyllobacterium salinisoli]RCS21809.1 hypothetical protein DUT91_21770 [Phyllobacterium salinisoli]